jgi:two-component system phosphate regulon response regulator PhoB
MGRRASILVVDDYADGRDLVAVALEAAGFEVHTAAGGYEALSLVRKHRPAAVIMDIAMPGLDGIETTRQLRTDPQFAATPVIAYSAQSGLEQLGLFDAVCPKPCSPEELLRLVRQLLG